MLERRSTWRRWWRRYWRGSGEASPLARRQTTLLPFLERLHADAQQTGKLAPRQIEALADAAHIRRLNRQRPRRRSLTALDSAAFAGAFQQFGEHCVLHVRIRAAHRRSHSYSSEADVTRARSHCHARAASSAPSPSCQLYRVAGSKSASLGQTRVWISGSRRT